MASDGRVVVFGYGSLAARVPVDGSALPVLPGVQRVWGVAMDNGVAVPGYKRYTDPVSGTPPACLVTFLDLVPAVAVAPGVNGVLLEVDADALATLDARERNYERIEVTDRLRPAPQGRVFAYVGSAEGRARAARGRAIGAGVVHRGYLDLVENAFAAHGQDELARYRTTTAAPDLPVRELERLAVPPVVGAAGASLSRSAR